MPFTCRGALLITRSSPQDIETSLIPPPSGQEIWLDQRGGQNRELNAKKYVGNFRSTECGQFRQCMCG